VTRLTGGRAGGQAGRTLRDARAGGRAEVFGSSTALEKEYLRLTALPTLGAVRPPAVLEQVRRALELHRALYVCKHGRLLADCGAAPAHALPADGRDPHSLAASQQLSGWPELPVQQALHKYATDKYVHQDVCCAAARQSTLAGHKWCKLAGHPGSRVPLAGCSNQYGRVGIG